jgi:hypothetical protein
VIGQLYTPAALPPAKEPLVPIGYEAGWDPEPVWTRLLRENLQTLAEIRTPNNPSRSPVLYH